MSASDNRAISEAELKALEDECARLESVEPPPSLLDPVNTSDQTAGVAAAEIVGGTGADAVAAETVGDASARATTSVDAAVNTDPEVDADGETDPDADAEGDDDPDAIVNTDDDTEHKELVNGILDSAHDQFDDEEDKDDSTDAAVEGRVNDVDPIVEGAANGHDLALEDILNGHDPTIEGAVNGHDPAVEGTVNGYDPVVENNVNGLGAIAGGAVNGHDSSAEDSEGTECDDDQDEDHSEDENEEEDQDDDHDDTHHDGHGNDRDDDDDQGHGEGHGEKHSNDDDEDEEVQEDGGSCYGQEGSDASNDADSEMSDELDDGGYEPDGLEPFPLFDPNDFPGPQEEQPGAAITQRVAEMYEQLANSTLLETVEAMAAQIAAARELDPTPGCGSLANHVEPDEFYGLMHMQELLDMQEAAGNPAEGIIIPGSSPPRRIRIERSPTLDWKIYESDIYGGSSYMTVPFDSEWAPTIPVLADDNEEEEDANEEEEDAADSDGTVHA